MKMNTTTWRTKHSEHKKVLPLNDSNSSSITTTTTTTPKTIVNFASPPRSYNDESLRGVWGGEVGGKGSLRKS